MRFVIGGIQKSSLIDYPGKISAVIFTQGCNFRCGYCHNPELIEFSGTSAVSSMQCLEFLKTRCGKLDGVVITGGEPCLQPDLKNFVREIKSLGFLVKLDTNGSKPDVLENLTAGNLLDYIAMDIKAPLEKYSEIVCTRTDTDKIRKSIDIIKSSNINYEFRTTVVKSQLNTEDFEQIGELIHGAQKYFLQKFVSSKIYDSALMNAETYTNKEFGQIVKLLNKYIKNAATRN